MRVAHGTPRRCIWPNGGDVPFTLHQDDTKVVMAYVAGVVTGVIACAILIILEAIKDQTH